MKKYLLAFLLLISCGDDNPDISRGNVNNSLELVTFEDITCILYHGDYNLNAGGISCNWNE